MADALNPKVSAFDFDILQSALRNASAEEREPEKLRHMAYELASALCPGQSLSEETINMLLARLHRSDAAADEA